MKFVLGGNHDENNTQTANELIADILDECCRLLRSRANLGSAARSA